MLLQLQQQVQQLRLRTQPQEPRKPQPDLLLQLQQQILDIQKNLEMLKQGKHDGYITAQAQRSQLLHLYEPDEPKEHISIRSIERLRIRKMRRTLNRLRRQKMPLQGRGRGRERTGAVIN
ncbi:uncharacterized protein LOC114882297 [Osmia bicornis bicornis]|uniref:uncharacterized protein LOC114882297 n=1 Tax=Osmia bicornis bicornis TaxID=1437191 RepID=UPI001EAF7F4C|nr:uncharacterized protein LOC114882297 [Osmia bicornis bicornis]